eukprot:XP_017945492.1 PREDICTED: uncharacterized protein LOC101734930 isoform X2 [Xenopus tropicalis]
MPVAQLFPEEQAFLPEEPGTCPVYPNGSASPEAAPAPQPNSLSTGNGHIETPGNQGQRSGWQRIRQQIQKHKCWLIIMAVLIAVVLVLTIVYATKAGDPGNNPDIQEKGSTDMGGALTWQNCNGTKLNISTEEAPWEDANTNCATYGGQLLAKSLRESISGCIATWEDFWIQQEGPHPERCEFYNKISDIVTLACDTRRRYICSKS